MGDLTDYLSLIDAARELGVSRARVDQYVRDGRLAVEWIAGRRVVLRSTITELKKIPRPPGRPPKPTPGAEQAKPSPKKRRKP